MLQHFTLLTQPPNPSSSAHLYLAQLSPTPEASLAHYEASMPLLSTQLSELESLKSELPLEMEGGEVASARSELEKGEEEVKGQMCRALVGMTEIYLTDLWCVLFLLDIFWHIRKSRNALFADFSLLCLGLVGKRTAWNLKRKTAVSSSCKKPSRSSPKILKHGSRSRPSDSPSPPRSKRSPVSLGLGTPGVPFPLGLSLCLRPRRGWQW